MAQPKGVADHPAKAEMEALWRQGMRAKGINQYLQEHGYPVVATQTLGRYGQRYWEGDGPTEVASRADRKVTRRRSSGPRAGRTHLVIPDTQVKPGVPTDHLRWIGLYAGERRPDVIVHLGDHWDMHSLSSYDKGKRQMEGRRYREDVRAGNEAMALLNEGIEAGIAKSRRSKEGVWNPDRRLLLGNHERRILRATELDPALDGTIGLHDLESPGWQVHDFLEPVNIDGVVYSHYFYNPMNGRPYSGMAPTRLKQIGHTFVMGHQQTLDVAVRYVQGRAQWAIIAGACYLHDEDYKGPQGNAHWRGVIVLHQVENGEFDPMFVSLDYLCRRYEGVSLETFLQEQDVATRDVEGVPL